RHRIRQRVQLEPIYIESRVEIYPMLKQLMRAGDNKLFQKAGHIGGQFAAPTPDHSLHHVRRGLRVIARHSLQHPRFGPH
ncbi:hypothetical protein RA261_27825, partial [Pseudomonas syringae pv. tagetis]